MKDLNLSLRLSRSPRKVELRAESRMCESVKSAPPIRQLSQKLRVNHGGASDKEPSRQRRRPKRRRLDPWVRKIPWRRKCQPTPVLLPGKKISWPEEPGGLQSMGSQRDTTGHTRTHTRNIASIL